MPAQMFVDSSGEENEDFEDDQSEDGRDVGGKESYGENLEEGDGGDDDNEEGVDKKGKKRKNANKRGEGRQRKKAKKLGPKEVKGSIKQGQQLTVEEVKELTAKEYAQYSNLYNVQIEEVLKEIKISEKKENELQTWFEQFKSLVEQIPKSKKFAMNEYEKCLRPILLPLPQNVLNEDRQWMEGHTFQWLPPSSVDVRGSWAVGTALKQVSSFDIFLEMPYEFLAKSDFLNHKYHFKRALYIGYLAKKLSERGHEIKFSRANGEPLKPVLSLQVNKVDILVHPVPPKDFFKLSKLASERNNLRYEHFFNTTKPEDEPETSTQHYNFTILEDSLANEIHEEVAQFCKNWANVRDAIKLLKIWVTQREISRKGYGGFSGIILTQFLRYLYSTGKINENMTSFQLIRVFFISVIQMDISENGISFNSNTDLKLVHMQWDILFLDSTGLLNYAANMSKLTFHRVQHEARRALSIIDDGNTTGFLALFITRVKFMLNFDHMIRFTQPVKLTKCLLAKPEYKPLLLNYSGYIYPVVVSIMKEMIETCLKNRITVVDCELPENVEWDVSTSAPKHVPSVIRFGININREISQSLIEKCESGLDHDIQEFKEFWGEKSELRRFKDGTLLESVVLKDLVGLGTSRVCYQMLNYIFKRHLGYDLSQEEYVDKQIENLIERVYLKVEQSTTKPSKSKKIYLHGKMKQKMATAAVHEVTKSVSVDQVNHLVSNSFDEISKMLRLLEELPLSISTVQGTSAVLRYSNILPTPPQMFFPSNIVTEANSKHKSLAIKINKEGKQVLLPSKLPKYVESVGIIIHLETSGQWPDDLKAIDRLKCAFLLKIGDLLTTKFGLTTQCYPRYLDVLKDGIVFRIRITYFRELTLLRELRGTDGVLRVRDNPESLRLEKEVLILPQLTSTLHSFHLQYEAFGITCRIAKRWVASQLLLASPQQYNRNLEEPDCRFSEESVELLVAYLFLNIDPYLTFPSEAHVGFQRFLYLVANTDFRAVPIVLNFNDKLTSHEVSSIELDFVKTRSTLPPLFIATPFDQKSSVWTRGLSAVILSRAQMLAREALLVMENHFSNHSLPGSDLMKIFRPSTNQFDVVIWLKRSMCTRHFQSVESFSKHIKYNEHCKKLNELIPVVDFDPVQSYLQDLRNTFGHVAIFLHDLYGGKFIAVVWKPDVFKSVSFTTTVVKGRQIGRMDPSSIVYNVNGALESFQVMGQGLVDKMETRSDKWKFDD